MSLDKLRINKVSRQSESYSRNPIINKLIRNKLQTEIISVKQSVTNLLKRQQLSQNMRTHTQSRIRKQKSYTITPKIINQSLSYDPIEKVKNYVQEFIISRQLQSYIVSDQKLNESNRARENPDRLAVKFAKADQLNYQVPSDLIEMKDNIKAQTLKQLGPEVWISDKPELSMMIEDRLELISEKNTFNFQILDANKDFLDKQKFKENLLKHSSSKSRELFNSPLTLFSQKNNNTTKFNIPIDYNSRRYHKDDYKSLQIWLEQSLEKLGKQISNQKVALQNTTDSEKSSCMKEQLDIMYGIYMSAWKQTIRLTYIQSYEKGLLIQKLLYSMLRLFGQMISQQHTTAKQYQSFRENDSAQIKKLLQNRCDQLSNKFEEDNFEIRDLKQKNYRLSLAYISYEKVNKQLITEVQKLNREKKKFEDDLNLINKAYVKALEQLYDKALINMDIDINKQGNNKGSKSSYKTYYLVGKDNKPFILGRFKYYQVGQNQYTKFEDQLQSAGSTQFFRYGRQLQQLQNEINRYWSKKEDDLEIRTTINSCLINIKIKDYGTGTVNIEPSDFSCQFPESNENYFQKLLVQQKQQLERQFKNQLSIVESQRQQKESLLQKWIASNQLNVEKIKSLQTNSQVVQEQLKQQKEATTALQQQLRNSIILHSQETNRSKSLEKEKYFLNNQILVLQQKIFTIENQMKKIVKEQERQKQNNQMLVRANLQEKQIAQMQKIKLVNLKEKIINLAPYLEQFLKEVDKSSKASEEEETIPFNLQLFIKISEKIQFYLGDFVERDSTVFMTKI